MNLSDIMGKCIISTIYSCGSSGDPWITITFADGSELVMDIKGQHGDAWLEYKYTEGTVLSPETKAELDGFS